MFPKQIVNKSPIISEEEKREPKYELTVPRFMFYKEQMSLYLNNMLTLKIGLFERVVEYKITYLITFS